MQQVPDAPEPSTEDREPYEFDIGENCGKCNLVIQDNWNCDKGCADKRIREGWSKPAPRCLAAHNAEPLVCASGMMATAYNKKEKEAANTAKVVAKKTAVLNVDDSVLRRADPSRNWETRCVIVSGPCCMHTDCCVGRFHQKVRPSKRSKHAEDNDSATVGGSTVATPSVMPAASAAPASANSTVTLPLGWPTAAPSQPACTAPAIDPGHAAFLAELEARGGNYMNGHAEREEAQAAAAQKMAAVEAEIRAEMFRVCFRVCWRCCAVLCSACATATLLVVVVGGTA